METTQSLGASTPSVSELLTDPIAAVGWALVLLAPAGWICLRRVARDRELFGKVGAGGAWLIWSIYLSFTVLTACVAWAGVWPLSIKRWAAWGLGGAFLMAGLALLIGGAWEFGSLGRMSGCVNGRLVQTGVYRWTRNPQNIGWGAALFGIALLGRSGAALGMAVFFAAIFYIYCPVEERYLAGVYGEDWERYQASTHRFFGLPKRSSNSGAAKSPLRWSDAQDSDMG